MPHCCGLGGWRTTTAAKAQRLGGHCDPKRQRMSRQREKNGAPRNECVLFTVAVLGLEK